MFCHRNVQLRIIFFFKFYDWIHGLWLFAFAIAAVLGGPVEPDQQNLEGHREINLTRSPHIEIGLAPNEIIIV